MVHLLYLPVASLGVCVCVHACVRACVRVCVCLCVYPVFFQHDRRTVTKFGTHINYVDRSGNLIIPGPPGGKSI